MLLPNLGLAYSNVPLNTFWDCPGQGSVGRGHHRELPLADLDLRTDKRVVGGDRKILKARTEISKLFRSSVSMPKFRAPSTFSKLIRSWEVGWKICSMGLSKFL